MIAYSSIDNFQTVTSQQMRELDRLSESSGFLLIQMMENAGRSLAEVALRIFQPKRVAVLAGSGGNGGGAMVAARHLSNLGTQVEVFRSSTFEGRTGIPAFQSSLLTVAGVNQTIGPDGFNPGVYDLIVDGLVGYSINGEPRGHVRSLIEATASTSVPILSLDIPSGLDPDSGEKQGLNIRPSATLTLAAIKQGLIVNDLAGELFLADLGIPRILYEELGISDSAPQTQISKIDY